jgi:hypothetical protein
VQSATKAFSSNSMSMAVSGTAAVKSANAASTITIAPGNSETERQEQDLAGSTSARAVSGQLQEYNTAGASPRTMTAACTCASSTIQWVIQVVTLIGQHYTSAFTANANLSQNLTKTFTVNGNLQKNQTKTFTANANLKANLNKTFSANANLTANLTKSVTANANLQQNLIQTFTVNTSLKKNVAIAFTVNANLLKNLTASFTVSANLIKNQTTQFTTDATLQQNKVIAFTCDAALIGATVGTATFTVGANLAIAVPDIPRTETLEPPISSKALKQFADVPFGYVLDPLDFQKAVFTYNQDGSLSTVTLDGVKVLRFS